MAKEHEDEFLQDVSLAEEEEYGEEEYTEEELELDALRAERDDLKDKWMRALRMRKTPGNAVIVIVERLKTMAARSSPVIYCRSMTISSVAWRPRRMTSAKSRLL